MKVKIVPVVLVEPYEILKEGLIRVLNKSRFRVVGAFKSLEDLWYIELGDDGIGMILVEVMEGARLTHEEVDRLRERYPVARIVLLSDPAHFREAIEVGKWADGLLLRTSRAGVLIKSLELILLGERMFPFDAWRESAPVGTTAPPPEVAHGNGRGAASAPLRSRQSEALRRLSEREMEVMRLLCNGDPNKVIGRRLGISDATVKVHVKAILRKTGAKNRTEAAMMMSAVRPPD